MYKTLHKKQGSVTVQLRFARSSVTFCAKRDNIDVQTDFVPIYSILAVSILFITAEDTYGEYIFFYEIM